MLPIHGMQIRSRIGGANVQPGTYYPRRHQGHHPWRHRCHQPATRRADRRQHRAARHDAADGPGGTGRVRAESGEPLRRQGADAVHRSATGTRCRPHVRHRPSRCRTAMSASPARSRSIRRCRRQPSLVRDGTGRCTRRSAGYTGIIQRRADLHVRCRASLAAFGHARIHAASARTAHLNAPYAAPPTLGGIAATCSRHRRRTAPRPARSPIPSRRCRPRWPASCRRRAA